MKTKLIISAILGVFLGIANAQITPATQKVSLSGNDKAILDQHISKHTAFMIDEKELTNYLHSKGGIGQFRLQIDENLDWTIDLELNDLRAPGYRAEYTTDEGTFECKKPFVVNTFKGQTSTGLPVAFTIDEHTFSGVILGENYHYVIRPTKDYTQNREYKSFIVYHSEDIIPDENNSHFTNDVLNAPKDAMKELIEHGDIRNSGNCAYFLRIATDADFQYHQARGSISAATTNGNILSVLNIVESVYRSTFGLRFAVTFQHVYTTNTQPYTSTDAGILLNSFREQWNTNRTEITRNIAHLFTGKTLNGGTWGVAWLGAINGNEPNNFAYALSMNRAEMYQTTAHEIGHNLGTGDVNLMTPVPPECLCGGNTASVMCQGLKHSNLWFCGVSIGEINSFLDNNLLDICGSTFICANTTETYTIQNPIPNSTITWNVGSCVTPVSPSIAGVPGTETSFTVALSCGTPGTLWIEAIISPEGQQQYTTPRINISPRTIPNSEFIGSMYNFCYFSNNCPFTDIITYEGVLLNSNAAEWTSYMPVDPPNPPSSPVGYVELHNEPTYGSYAVVKPVYSNGSEQAIVHVRVGNGCGWSNWAPITYNKGPHCPRVNYNDPCNPPICINGTPYCTGGCVLCNPPPQCPWFCECCLQPPTVSCHYCLPPHIPRCKFCFDILIEFKSYPNPVSDILYVNLDMVIEEQRTTSSGQSNQAPKQPIQPFDIRLYNKQGVVVRQAKASEGTVEFNVYNLPEGTYFLHIEYEGEIEKHQIIIKRS